MKDSLPGSPWDPRKGNQIGDGFSRGHSNSHSMPMAPARITLPPVNIEPNASGGPGLNNFPSKGYK